MRTISIGEYLTLVEVPRPDLRTEFWEVVSSRHNTRLGVVKWFGRWRQYAFFPEPDTIYNRDCLIDIAVFVKRLMDARSR